MKRVLSLVLALVLVLGTILPVFAEDAMTAGEELKSLGVIAGSDTGLDEEKALTRAQAAVVISEMYGKKDEAAAYAFPASFTDVEEGMWYTPYIAYAEAQGWMSGDGEGLTFRPNDTMKAQELNAMYLVVLGYTVDWAEVNAKATELEFAVDAADATLVLRGEAFEAILAALDVLPMDEEATLGTKLALEGYVAPEAPAPAALEVVSVKALNLKQIEVVFNQEIDAAGDEDNYSMTDDGTGTITSASDFELLEDGMTVVITLTANAAQQDVETLEVTDVETADELAVVDFEGEVTFLDTTIPTVVGAEVVGNDTIKVVFSEPMNGTDKANFEVNDGKKLYVKSATLQNNNTEVLVELYSALADGDVDIEVLADTEDYAAFGVTPVTMTVTVVEDEDAPVVIDYKDATPTGVTLVWSEDIEENGTFDAANYYHTNSNNEADSITVDGNEMEIVFTTNELPQGTAYVYVLKEAVNDLWDLENAQEMIAVEVELDETAPAVDGDVSVETESEIEIDFTEDMDADSVTDEDNYTLLDEDGEEIDDEIISVVAKDANTVTITFDSELSGMYSIVLADLEDLAGNEIVDTTLEFEVDDLTAPLATDFDATIYNPGTADQMIRVNFGDVMAVEGEYSILDAAKYTFNVGHATEFTLDTVDEDFVAFAVVNDGKSVEITVPSVADDATEGVDLLDAQDIYISKVADAQDNVTLGIFNTIDAADVSDEGTIANPTVEITAVDTVVMSFGQEVAALEVDDFIVETTADTLLPLSSVQTSLDDDGYTVVTFTLVTDLDSTAKSGGVAVRVDSLTQTSENAYGEAIQDFAVTGTDEIAPEVDYIVFVTTSVIEVHFTEDLDPTFFAAGMNGFTVSDATSAVAGATADVVTIAGADFTINTNVAYADGAGLEDANDNGLASFSETAALDAAKITVVAADPVDNTFTVTANYELANAIVVGDVDMDTVTAAVQDTIAINGITYTATVTTGTVTITATGTSTAIAVATTADFEITMDGHTETVTMNIAAYAAASAAATQVTIAAN